MTIPFPIRRIVFALLLVSLPLGIFLFEAHVSGFRHARSAPAAAQPTLPQILKEIDSRLDPQTFPYLNTARAAALKAQIDRTRRGIGGNPPPIWSIGMHANFSTQANRRGADDSQHAPAEDPGRSAC